jgi:hypothetical protein
MMQLRVNIEVLLCNMVDKLTTAIQIISFWNVIVNDICYPLIYYL